MKILLVSNMSPSGQHPYRGIFIRRVGEKLQDNGHSVTWIEMKEHIHKLISYLLWWTSVWFRLVFPSPKYNLIYAHFVKYSIIPFILMPKSVLSKTVFNFHGSDLYTGALLTKVMKKILPRSGLIIAPSAFFCDEIIRVLGIKREKIFVYPSGGVNTNDFKPVYPVKQSESGHPVQIGYVSSIIEGKGWKDLFYALLRLKDEKMEFKCTFVGSGADETQLKELISTYQLSGMVSFAGRKAGDELIDFYNSLDIFVFPSERESLGLVGLEAMACGVPVLGSDIGGIKSYLREGYNGFLYRQGCVDDLTAKLIHFVSVNEAERKLLGLQARLTAEEYDRDLRFKALEDEFFKVSDASGID